VLSLEKSLKDATAAGNMFGGSKDAQAKADPKEVKALKSELAKTQEAIREKDSKCKSSFPCISLS